VHERITSTANPRVKRLVALRDRRARDDEGVFLLEGYRAVRRALDAGVALRELYVCPELFLGSNEGALTSEAEMAGATVTELSEAAFRRCAYRDRPEGLLGVAAVWRHDLDDLEALLGRRRAGADGGPAPLLLIADAIEKPGNLGALLRTADAAGCLAVVVCEPVTDVFNPNIVRASTGALFTVPVVNEPDPGRLRAWLRRNGIATVVTTPSAERICWDADLTGPVAIVVGSEMHGLPGEWIEAADVSVRIPMAGSADSLNVGTAAAVVVFEAVRQRHRAGTRPDPRPGTRAGGPVG
jgi:TrmH family RNA methyltransferase